MVGADNNHGAAGEPSRAAGNLVAMLRDGRDFVVYVWRRLERDLQVTFTTSLILLGLAIVAFSLVRWLTT